MNRLTITTLGQLQVGDRFTFPKGNEVWQVTEQIRPSNTAFNKFHPSGAKVLKFDEIKRASTSVRFLRHTQLSDISTEKLPNE